MNPALLRTVDVAAVTREFRWAHTRNLLDAGSRQNGQPRQECVPVACAVQKLEHLLRQGDQGALQDSKTRQHGSLSPGQTDATCCMQHCWVMLQHVEQGWPNERNIGVQHGGQTHATCCLQQRSTMLHQHVVQGFMLQVTVCAFTLCPQWVRTSGQIEGKK